jgi:hypothetical protein
VLQGLLILGGGDAEQELFLKSLAIWRLHRIT